MTLIANARLIDSDLISSLNASNVRYSAGLAPDLIFNDCSPSLSVLVLRREEIALDRAAAIQRINSVQAQFRNSFAVLVGETDEAAWLSLQCEVLPGPLRLYRVRSEAQLSRLILAAHETMRNKERAELQAAYFAHLQKQSVAHETSRAILAQCLGEMDVADKDIALVVQHFRSPARLIAQSLAPPRIPGISEEALEQVKIFFNSPTPTLSLSLTEK